MNPVIKRAHETKEEWVARREYQMRRQKAIDRFDPDAIDEEQAEQREMDKRAKIERILQERMKIHAKMNPRSPETLGVGDVENFQGGMLRDYLEQSVQPANQRTMSLTFQGDALSGINFS